VYLRDVIKIRQNPTLQMLETFILATKYYYYHEEHYAEKFIIIIIFFFAVKLYDSFPIELSKWQHGSVWDL